MNPCPCGWLGAAHKACRCTPDQVSRYQGKLSGPLLDRIDLHVDVPTLPPEQLLTAPAGESTQAIRERCAAARDRAVQRQGKANQGLQGKEIDTHAALDDAAAKFLNIAAARLGWSARSTHRALKVARTIADLAGAATTEVAHVAEAVQYRRALAATSAPWCYRGPCRSRPDAPARVHAYAGHETALQHDQRGAMPRSISISTTRLPDTLTSFSFNDPAVA